MWPNPITDVNVLQEEDVNVQLPAEEIQDQLLDSYFTYVHPTFPVIHKAHFMVEYNMRYAA